MFGSVKRLVGALVPGVLALLFYVYILHDLPNPRQLVQQQQPTSSVLYDRNGQVLYYFHGDEHRIPIPLAQVSQAAIDATLAIEDQGFYHHYGFSVTGIVRAVRNNFSSDTSLEGGSTLTQQLVKNRLLSREKKLVRKVKELILSLWVEALFSKREILALYLNDVSYGGTAHGIEAAAQKYFRKSAAALNVPEGALLAGLLKAPTHYSPYGKQRKRAIARQRQVLGRMRDEGYLSPSQFTAAADARLKLAPNSTVIRAPHFVMFVKEQLEAKFGPQRLNTGGLRIESTLDLALQADTQRRLSAYIDQIFRYRVSNGAILITNPHTGEILSMVGSVDYFDAAIDGQVNVVLQLRQPGSSIKPLTYAMSLDAGKTPLTLLNDREVEFEIPGEGNYKPRNDDYTFRGKVTLRNALASSYNIPAVKELASIGVLNYVAKAREVGISNWEDQNEYRVALTLGSAEVRMLDMAQLYSAFVNQGSPIEPYALLRVTDPGGKLLFENPCIQQWQTCLGKPVFTPESAFLINDILADDEARAATFGSNSDLNIARHEVAVKTGTTNFLRDNWTIGYTTQRLVAVWIGNNDGAPMRFIHSGEHGASTIWNSVMNALLAHSAPHRFAVPNTMIIRRVCPTTGTLTCIGCETERDEYFAPGTEPTQPCNQLPQAQPAESPGL